MTHGSYVTYTVGKCRCEECRKANRDYEKARAKRNAYGRSFFVDAEPVRERVRALYAAGMTENEVERAANLDAKVLEALFRKHWRTGRPVQRMKRENAERIFAVKRRAVLPWTVVEDKSFRVMALDLMALGYPAVWISERLGLSYQGRKRLLASKHRASTVVAMRRLHGSTTERAEGRGVEKTSAFAQRMARRAT